MDLKTTTSPRRRANIFNTLQRFVEAPSSGRPLEVANVGPGLAVKYLGRLSAIDMPGWDFFRRIEAGVRRVPMPDAFYENYETMELVAALRNIPFRLTLIDINPRVVRVAAQGVRGHKVDTVVADLGEERSVRLAPYRGKFDLVVAFAVVGRVRDRLRENARDNVGRLVRPGGLLLGTDTGGSEFTLVAPDSAFYRKAGVAAQERA
ncbi:MAG: class I SAM-dependent methyltransferase [Bauldia sp.]